MNTILTPVKLVWIKFDAVKIITINVEAINEEKN